MSNASHPYTHITHYGRVHMQGQLGLSGIWQSPSLPVRTVRHPNLPMGDHLAPTRHFLSRAHFNFRMYADERNSHDVVTHQRHLHNPWPRHLLKPLIIRGFRGCCSCCWCCFGDVTMYVVWVRWIYSAFFNLKRAQRV